MSEGSAEENEISLADVASSLWANRGIIVAVPFITISLAMLYLALSALTVSRPVTYMINLKGIENRSYPNGSAFSPHDLLIPEVLSEVRNRFGLPADAPLRRAISVSYDSLTAEGIARSYRDRLGARALTPAEIAAINEAYLDELRNAMRSSLRITVDYRTLGMDSNLGISIAKALPEIWTSVYSTQFRIFTNVALSDVSVTRDFEDLQSTSSLLAANARLAIMRQGLNTLAEDNRLALFHTANGLSATDLRVELRRLETIFFDPLKAVGLQKDDPIAASYLSRLQLEISDKRRRVAAHDDSLRELRTFHRAQNPTATTDQTIASDRSAVQVGETALAEIVHMAERASLTGFVQEILRQRSDLMFEISDLTKEVDISTRQGSAVFAPEFRSQAAEVLQEFTTRYSELVTAAQGQLRDRSDTLYEPALGPLINDSLLQERSLLILASSAVLGGLIGILIAFLRSSRLPSRKTKDAGT